ncbi:MAG: response regulator [Bacteroidales bacterium]
MSQITVLVADDNGPIRELLTTALAAHFTVRRSVGDGKQLVEAAIRHHCDVIVTDVWMPVLNGIEALRILREMGRTTPCVMISADADVGPDCLAAGANAFVCKLDLEQSLVAAVAAAAAGTPFLPSPVNAPARRDDAIVPVAQFPSAGRIDGKA